jgi:hypothetical protein
MEKSEMLAVSLDEDGVIHAEGGKLIVGDMDIVKAALAMWGGNRQRGRVVLQIFIQAKGSINTSPDLNGTFAEPSEPAA